MINAPENVKISIREAVNSQTNELRETVAENQLTHLNDTLEQKISTTGRGKRPAILLNKFFFCLHNAKLKIHFR